MLDEDRPIKRKGGFQTFNGGAIACHPVEKALRYSRKKKKSGRDNRGRDSVNIKGGKTGQRKALSNDPISVKEE